MKASKKKPGPLVLKAPLSNFLKEVLGPGLGEIQLTTALVLLHHLGLITQRSEFDDHLGDVDVWIPTPTLEKIMMPPQKRFAAEVDLLLASRRDRQA